jgi:hypothetical protein
MRILPELLIDGCVRTLQEKVLPGVTSRFARGQLYAVLDVLQNLRDRVEEKSALQTAEADSAAGALARAAGALRGGNADAVALADELAARAAAVPAGPPEARRDALNAALVLALERLASVGGPAAEAAHGAIGGHLAAQVIREVSTLKPSMFEEISRG